MNELFYQLEEDLKNKVLKTIEDLKENYKLSDDLDIFSNVDNDICISYIENITGSNVIEETKPQLNNPFSIAKYISLYEEQLNNIDLLDKFLSSFLDKGVISWNIHQDFKSNVIFFKTDEEGVINNLSVTYKYTDDKKGFTFTICSNCCHWDIDKYQLKQLLEGNVSTNTKPETYVNSVNTTNEDVKLQFNGTEILIRKL